MTTITIATKSCKVFFFRASRFGWGALFFVFPQRLKSPFSFASNVGAPNPVGKGAALFGGAPSAKANDGDDSNRRVAYAEFRLHQSILYFGYYSPQAAYWRHDRHETYEQLERYRHRDRDEDDD
jgi:hypothetical protein